MQIEKNYVIVVPKAWLKRCFFITYTVLSNPRTKNMLDMYKIFGYFEEIRVSKLFTTVLMMMIPVAVAAVVLVVVLVVGIQFSCMKI